MHVVVVGGHQERMDLTHQKNSTNLLHRRTTQSSLWGWHSAPFLTRHRDHTTASVPAHISATFSNVGRQHLCSIRSWAFTINIFKIFASIMDERALCFFRYYSFVFIWNIWMPLIKKKKRKSFWRCKHSKEYQKYLCNVKSLKTLRPEWNALYVSEGFVPFPIKMNPEYEKVHPSSKQN